MTCYCSKDCQKAHLDHHSEYCSMIVDLKIIETEKLYRNHSVRQVQVDDKLKSKLVKLVGDKPMLHCALRRVQWIDSTHAVSPGKVKSWGLGRIDDRIGLDNSYNHPA